MILQTSIGLYNMTYGSLTWPLDHGIYFTPSNVVSDSGHTTSPYDVNMSID